MTVEVVEVIVRAGFKTKNLSEETIRRAIRRIFSHEIRNNDRWHFYNGRDILADVEIKIGNAGASIDFRVKAWQVEKFVEVLEEKIKELEKLVDELARQKELDEVLNGNEVKSKTLAEAFIENGIDVVS